jgi:hypothetical protein
MPFSNQDSIPTVMYFAAHARPRRILDVGVGLGIYGLLLRCGLDIVHERPAREMWQLRIEGLEIFPGYHNPVWTYAYDQVHIGDVRTHPFPPDSFDVVLITDVLEHLTREEAVHCVTQLLIVAPIVILTTPVHHISQGAWGGNVHETHRSILCSEDFPDVACTKVTGLTFCSVCCRDPGTAEDFRFAAGTAPVARPEWLPYLAYRIRRKLRTLADRRRAASPP